MMSAKRFHLLATISTDNPAAIRPVLTELFGAYGTLKEVGPKEAIHGGKGEFRLDAELEGASAKELNRTLLSALRKVEKKTRLRAAWTSGGTIEQFFDYVLKKTSRE